MQARHGRLAAARLADQREGLALGDREARRRRPPAAIWRGRPLEHAVEPGRARRRSSAPGPSTWTSAASGIDHALAPARRRRRVVQPAGGAACAPAGIRSGRSTQAALERARAARVEGAARRDRVQPRHRAVDLRQPLALARRCAGSSPSGPWCRDARRCWITSRTGPISTMRPAYITATRSAVSAITPMSCVTSITAVPCSRHRRLSSAMICAWIETSSAVVGSSATIRRGLGARAPARSPRAGACRRRTGADSGRCAARRPGCRPRSSSSMRARAAPRRRDSGRCVWIVSIELPADRVERVQRGQRVLEDRADLARRGSVRISS